VYKWQVLEKQVRCSLHDW